MRAELAARADASPADFVEAYPQAAEELETSAGHGVAWVGSGMPGPLKSLGGKGVIVDGRANTLTVLDIGEARSSIDATVLINF